MLSPYEKLMVKITEYINYLELQISQFQAFDRLILVLMVSFVIYMVYVFPFTKK